MVTWQAVINETTIEPNLFDVEVVDTANPFGSYAVIKIDDTNGDRFAAYPRGTRVDLNVAPTDLIDTSRTHDQTGVTGEDIDVSVINSIEVELYGPGGGDSNTHSGGVGGYLRVRVDTSDIDTLTVYPGEQGSPNGGIGGGEALYNGGSGVGAGSLESGGGASATSLVGDGVELAHADGGGGAADDDGTDGTGGGGGARGGSGGNGFAQDGQGTGFGGDGGDPNTAQADGQDGGVEAVDPRVTVLESQTGGGNTTDGEITLSNSINRFTGYVVERREGDSAGADTLEVECYTFDQFLRRNTVSDSTVDLTISAALNQIITDDTPIEYVSANVQIQDDQTLTQELRGKSVESAIQAIRSKSAGETFGVNSNLEFFFRPLESESAPRDISNTQWLNYDIPEEGKRTKNEVTVFYGGPDSGSSVTVSDGADKQELQENVGTSDPITLSEEITREDIDNVDDARDVAERTLQGKSTTLTGTVTTFGLYTAEPGDVIDVTIVPRGIDTQFRIAEIEYVWGTDETNLTIVEKRGDNDQTLVNLSETVDRVESREANRDGVNNRVTSTAVGVDITTTGDVDGTAFDSAIWTNTGRNKLRDAWAGNGNLNIAEIAVGTGTDAPKRSQTALVNETERQSATQSLPDATSAEYDASITTTDIREVGLFDSAGDLLARGIIPDTTLTSPVAVTVTIDVSNDTEVNRGVITTAGQTAVRDTIADNTPKLPTQYAFGSDGTMPSEADTALGTEIVKQDLESILIQSADNQAEWDSIVPEFADTSPLVSQNGVVENHQSGFFQEGENYDRGNEGFDDGSTDTEISNADYASLSRDENVAGGPDFVEYEFTLNYTIPEGDSEIYFRISDNGSLPEATFELIKPNGNAVLIDENRNFGITTGDFTWRSSGFFTSPQPEEQGELQPGDYTFRITVTNSNGSTNGNQLWIDAVTIVDTRFSYTFDETTDANDALSGPEMYPELTEFALATADTRRTLTEAVFNSTWRDNDVSNNQYVELANDGATFTRFNNATTGTATFASSETGVDTNIGISRYATDTLNTPTNGDTSQAIDAWELFADVDAINPSDIGVVDVQAIIPPNTLTGQTIREGGQLAADDTLLTRTLTDEFTVESNVRVISSESVTWLNPE